MEKGLAIEKFVKYMLITNMSLATIESYERDVRLFLMYLESDRVDNINRVEVEEYLYHLVSTATKESVIKKKHASLKSFFKFLNEQGILTINPMVKGIKIPKNLTPVKVSIKKQAILDNINKVFETQLSIRDKVTILLMLISGLSVVELSQLKTTDIKMLNMPSQLPCAIVKKIQEELDKYLQTVGGELLLMTGRQQPLTYKYIRQLVLTTANLPELNNIENFIISIE